MEKGTVFETLKIKTMYVMFENVLHHRRDLFLGLIKSETWCIMNKRRSYENINSNLKKWSLHQVQRYCIAKDIKKRDFTLKD